MIVVVGDYDALLLDAAVCEVTPPNLEGGGAHVLYEKTQNDEL